MTTDGSFTRARGAARRLLGRDDPAVTTEQAAAIEDLRTEVAALRADLAAFGLAGDRTGDRIEALARRVDELTERVTTDARPIAPEADGATSDQP